MKVISTPINLDLYPGQSSGKSPFSHSAVLSPVCSSRDKCTSESISLKTAKGGVWPLYKETNDQQWRENKCLLLFLPRFHLPPSKTVFNWGRRTTKGVAVVQSLGHIWLFVTSWTAAHQASVSFTISRSLLNSCPLSQWCHPTLSSSVAPISSCPQSFPASGSFPISVDGCIH